MESTRKCTRCDKMQPTSLFGKHRHCKDGLNPECKVCNRERSRVYAKTPQGIYSSIKGRVNHYKHKTLNITKTDFVEWYNDQEKTCRYCSIPETHLHLLKPRFQTKASRLTIDCKDNERGYFVDNLVLACCRCNSIKCDELTYEEMLEFGQKYLRPKWENRGAKT